MPEPSPLPWAATLIIVLEALAIVVVWAWGHWQRICREEAEAALLAHRVNLEDPLVDEEQRVEWGDQP